MTRARPDAQTIIEQLLLAHARTPGSHLLRRIWLSRGAYAFLRAAGLAADRARAVNTMAYRQARAWRRDRVDVDDDLVADAAQRLLV